MIVLIGPKTREPIDDLRAPDERSDLDLAEHASLPDRVFRKAGGKLFESSLVVTPTIAIDTLDEEQAVGYLRGIGRGDGIAQ
jgi:hypothetical protein